MEDSFLVRAKSRDACRLTGSFSGLFSRAVSKPKFDRAPTDLWGLCGGDEGLAPGDLVRRPEVVAHIQEGLRAHNARHAGSASRIARVLLMLEPPSLDAGETTDKGYINQRRTLDRRADLVERLYTDPPPDDVIVI